MTISIKKIYFSKLDHFLYHVRPITYDIVDHCLAFSQLPITHYQPQQI
ncbi:MAG: hypothetical protein ACKPHF_10745 [Dolichospermum sp.]